MRMINIGFNVQTDKAVKSLNDLEKKLLQLNQYVKFLEEKHTVKIDTSEAKTQIDDLKKKGNEPIIGDKPSKESKKNLDSLIEQLEIMKIRLDKVASGAKFGDEVLKNKSKFESVSREANNLKNKMSELQMSISKIGDKSDIPKLKAQLIDLRQEFSKLNNTKFVAPKVQGGGADLGNLVGYYAVFNTIKSQMSNFMALEDATYDLGVVAQFTDAQIQTMRKTIIDTATTLPNSAVEITKAMDAVMRTGKSYEEATNIVENTAKLAVASGEDLANAVGIVNKLFLALDINARNTDVLDKALQQLHATAVFTATDLEGLGESAKQWAGAVGGLVKTTTKTGSDLETYKSQLLDMGTAFSGILSDMGRSAEQSGTTIREFFTKLVTADKSALDMLDKDLKERQVMINAETKELAKAGEQGVRLTAESISKLAQEDMVKAVNLMSNLVSKGLIDMETVIKIFNGRYGLVVSNMLRTIEGNIEGYNEKVNEMTKLNEDFDKQMNNLNNQWGLFKNRLVGANGAVISSTKNFLNLIALVGNFALGARGADDETNNFRETLVGIGVSTISTTLIVGAFVGGLSKLVTTLKSAELSMTLFGSATKVAMLPVAGWILGISALVSVMAHFVGEARAEKAEIESLNKSIKDQATRNAEATATLKHMRDTLNSIDFSNASNEYGNLSIALKEITGSANSAYDSLMNVKNLSDQMQALAKKGASDTVASAYFKLDDQVRFQEKKIEKLKKEFKATGSPILDFKGLREITDAEKVLLQLKDARDKAHGEKIEADKEYVKAMSDLKDQMSLGLSQTVTAGTVEDYQSLIDLMGTLGSKYKNVNDLYADLEKKGFTKQVEKFKSAIDDLSKSGVKLGYNQIISEDILKKVLLFRQQNEKILDMQDRLSKTGLTPEVKKQYELVLETTRRARLALLETFKHETNNRDNSKSSNLVTFEAIELTNKLAEARAKLVQFSESDLQFFLMKVDAEKKAYVEQQAKLKSVITTKLTKEQLELEIKRYEKLYQGKEVAKETDEAYKSLVKQYKYIDELQANEENYNKGKLENQIEFNKLLLEAKNALFDMESASISLAQSQLKLNELQNERLSVGETEEERYKEQIKLIMQKYLLELEQLQLKEAQLKANLKLEDKSYDNLKKIASSQVSQQRTGVASYVSQQKTVVDSFASGGYTGDGGKYQPAGIVHAGELVIDAKTLKENPSLISLYYGLKNGTKGYSTGGVVGASDFLKSKESENIDPHLIKWLSSFIEDYSESMKKDKVSLYISDAIRTLEEQKKLMASGKSKTLNSKHLTGNAIDLVFKNKEGKLDWNDSTKWLEKANESFIKYLKDNKIQGTWGGDFDKNPKTKDTFIDKFHFQTDSIYDYKKNTLETQKMLNKEGYKLKEDGIWGKNTEKAYLDYQSKKQSTMPSKQDDSYINSLIEKYIPNNSIEKIISKSLGNYNLSKPESYNLDNITSKDASLEQSTLNARQQSEYETIMEVQEKMLDYEKLRLDYSRLLADSIIARMKASEEEANKANEYKKALEEQYSFKSRMWNNDKKNQEYSNKLAKSNLDEQRDSLNSYFGNLSKRENEISEERDSLWKQNEDRYKKEGKLSDDEILNIKQEFDLTTKMIIAETNRLGDIEYENKLQEYNLNILKQQNTELEQQRQNALAISSAIVNGIGNLMSGNVSKLNFSQMSEGLSTALAKKSMGKNNATWNSSDWISVVGATMTMIDQVAQNDLAFKLKGLDAEQQALSIRLQGAKTEEEKLELQKQQLTLQMQAIDLAYQQQTSFMGISGGTTTSALSGALGGAMGGVATGLQTGKWGLAIAGGVMGLLGGIESGRQAKMQANIQKDQLLQQQMMTTYLANMAEQTKTTNDIMSTMASQGNKVGIKSAFNSVIQTMAQNPSQYQIGGTGSSSYTKTYSYRKWYGKKKSSTSTLSKTASYDLSTYGYSFEDLKNTEKMQDLVSIINSDIAKNQELMTEVNTEQYAQAKANIEALDEMLGNLTVTMDMFKSLGQQVFNSYFGGTLKEIYDESGQKITSYYTDWTEYLASKLQGVYESAQSDLLANANGLTSDLMSGIRNIYIQNYSGMNSIIGEFTTEYEALSKILSQSSTSMNMTAVASTMDKLVELVKKYKNEQNNVNEISAKFIDMWIKQGGNITDVYDSMNSAQKGIFDIFKTSLGSSSYEDLMSSLGSSIGDTFMNSFKDKIMNTSQITSAFQSMYSQLVESSNSLTIQSASNLYSEIQKSSVALEYQARQAQSIASIFGNEGISYNNDQVSYQTGSSRSTISNFYLTSNVNSDFVLANNEAEIDSFVTKIASNIKNALVDIGADI